MGTAAATLPARPPAAAAPEARQLLAGLPLRFEPAPGRLEPRIKFWARDGGNSVLFSAREVTLRMAGEENAIPASLSIRLPGSNPSPRIEGVGRLPSTSNYLLGRKGAWRTGVPNYRGVRYRAVYPGIDVIFYGVSRGIEYDFHVAPGADPRRIRIRFRGSDRLSLTPEGDLRLEAGGREVVQKKPLAYQEGPGATRRREIACAYRLLGANETAFELGEYDTSLPLVIDPVLVYASFFGGGTNDSVTAIKVDSAGMVYLSGFIDSSDISSTGGSFQPEPAGDRDIFIAKLDPKLSGPESLVYFTYLGGKGADTPSSMAIDASGNIYLAGSTKSSDFPLGGFARQNQLAGAEDAFALKLNPSAGGPASLAYSTYLGGSDAETAHGIAVDPTGLIYVTGITKSEDFPVAGAAPQKGRWGEQDAFVSVLDPNATDSASALVFSTYLGGEKREEGRAIAAPARGVFYVVGNTTSDIFPATGGSFQVSFRGGGDAFITHMDISKAEPIVYSTYFGGTGYDEARAVALDPKGRLLVTGYTLSMDFPVTPEAYQPAPRRVGQIFLSRVDFTDPYRSFLNYSTYLGGSGGEAGYDVHADAANVYLTGYTLSNDFPVTGQALQPTYGGGVDVFCTVLNLDAPPAQALVYSTYIGGTGINVGQGVAAANDGTVYVAGNAQDRRFPVSDNAVQNVHRGGLSDGFILGVSLGDLAEAGQPSVMNGPPSP